MPEVKVTCAGCPYLIQCDGGHHCMATSCPDEEEPYDFSKIPTYDSKDILVFKFNTNFHEKKEIEIVNRWGGLLEQMRDKGIIILPNYIDLITIVPNSDIEIYNSEGEELCLEQKKL